MLPSLSFLSSIRTGDEYQPAIGYGHLARSSNSMNMEVTAADTTQIPFHPLMTLNQSETPRQREWRPYRRAPNCHQID
jgi:hypothetical protein